MKAGHAIAGKFEQVFTMMPLEFRNMQSLIQNENAVRNGRS
jgi:hypothetical protein